MLGLSRVRTFGITFRYCFGIHNAVSELILALDANAEARYVAIVGNFQGVGDTVDHIVGLAAQMGKF
jgi:hypothetical protein